MQLLRTGKLSTSERLWRARGGTPRPLCRRKKLWLNLESTKADGTRFSDRRGQVG